MSNKRTTTKTTTTVTRGKKPKANNSRRRKANNNARVPSHGLHMAPCTRMYAKALVNPFAVQGLPCIPDNIVLPSYKFMTKARGVFSCGTNGVGYILIDPFQMLVNNGSYVADIGGPHIGGAIYYTNKAYTLGAQRIQSGGTLDTGVAVANPGSLFAYSDFDTNSGTPSVANRQFRLVACGLRVNYIGSNLYNAGRLIIWRNQGCRRLESDLPYTANDFLQDNYTSLTTVSRGSKYVYYVPDDPTFIAYNPYNDYCPNLHLLESEAVNHHCMGVYIDGGSVDPNQQSWEFEAVAFFETIGGGFTLSRSEGDPVGHDVVLSSLPNSAPTQTPASVESSVISQFIKGFAETTREVAYNVGRQAIGYAANAAVNYYNQSSRQLYLMPS